MTGTDLVAPAALLDVRTGELLEATPENAAELLVAARQFRSQITDSIKACEWVLREESQRRGSKTLHLPAGTMVVSGGQELAWDIEVLDELRAAGLPEDRFNELVVATVSYRVNAAVAKQLAGANPEYARVIEAAKSYTPKPWRISVS